MKRGELLQGVAAAQIAGALWYTCIDPATKAKRFDVCVLAAGVVPVCALPAIRASHEHI